MEVFDLPHTTKVNRVVPKNAFDNFTTAKQKKLFTDLILRITWLYKLSPDTLNLEAKEVKEIQIFRIELKVKIDIQSILDVIDKAIPYSIIFVVVYEGSLYMSSSIKHNHLSKENKSVVDCTLKTPWLSTKKIGYTIRLKKSIDWVYQDFCVQLAGKPSLSTGSLDDLTRYVNQKESLEKQIENIKIGVRNSKQYNKKVELNLLLREKMKEYLQLISA